MSYHLRLGVHPNNLTLRVLARTTFLDERLAGTDTHVSWRRFPSGPRTVDYIGAGAIDLGGTGATPPIAGQAKGIPLVYVATSDGRAVGGIAVARSSTITSVAGLRGARVALAVGSWLQQLLATALDANGLTWSDIVPLDLNDRDARAALADGGIEAWVTGNSDVGNDLRLIAETSSLISNPSVFFASRTFVESQPAVLDATVAALDDADEWIAAHSADAAQLLAGDVDFNDGDVDWQASIARRPWGVHGPSDAFFDEQQRTADLLFRFGLIGRRIDVRDASRRHIVNRNGVAV